MIKGMDYNNPGFTRFANMKEWPDAISNVIAKFPNCKIVIPGHGIEGDNNTLLHMKLILDNWNLKNKQ
jgi:hypothetical protein